MIRTSMFMLLGCALFAQAPHAQEAGITSQAQIEAALKEKPKTRGLVVRATREEGKSGTAVVAEPQSEAKIDLNIPFGSNSSELQPQAVAQLEALRSALRSPGLSDSQFLVSGHTDARGSSQSNQALSLQRANAVKTYLVARGVDAQRLKAAGEGETHLLTPDDPDNAVNRRVEIRNLGSTP